MKIDGFELDGDMVSFKFDWLEEPIADPAEDLKKWARLIKQKSGTYPDPPLPYVAGKTFHKFSDSSVKGMKPTMVHYDEVPTPKKGKLGDDRAANFAWTPEELQKDDPTHPDADLHLPGYVLNFLNEREKLAGREPLLHDEEKGADADTDS